MYAKVFHLSLPKIIQEDAIFNYYLNKKTKEPRSNLVCLGLHR